MADQIPIERKYSVEYLVGSLVAGLVIGVLVSSLWIHSSTIKKTPSLATTTTSDIAQTAGKVPAAVTSPTATKPSTSDLLIIANQPAGLSVVVAKANVGDNDWIVIHEDVGGMPGRALGAARFVGGSTSGTVELLRGTVPGNTYHGLIYKDDGDHIFSIDRDVPVRDSAGNPIQVTFTTN